MSKYSYEFKKKVVSEYLKQLEEENHRRKARIIHSLRLLFKFKDILAVT